MKFFKNLYFITLIALSSAPALTANAAQHEPYSASRIFWDMGSRTQLFDSGTYARIIELNDGRLLGVAESGGGISICWSNNRGASWSPSERIVTNGNALPNAVPDVAQLSDGTIIIGYNPRPSKPYSEERKFGIRAVRSTDGGKTWSEPIFIYDASHTNADGCWEPAFLELPSGELHCYFANEFPFMTSNEQEISMCRSTDGGKTWGEAQRICYRAGSRDGMPVPILTENNEIVVIIEDNGWPGRHLFRATTVRCPLSENWSDWVDASSSRREMIFASDDEKYYVSAAPYLRKLGKNETIASWQGDRGERNGKGNDFYEMCVAVGDADARNFKAVVAPFALDTNSHGLWNSVTALDDGTVFAISSVGSPSTGNVIYTVTGHAMTGFEAAWGTPAAIDGTLSGDNYTTAKGNQIFMGANVSRQRANMDFSYDAENLYFYAMVTDRTIFTDKVDNDGVVLYLDLDNACDTYPQKGMHRIFFNADGSIEHSAGNGGKWQSAVVNPEGIKGVAKVARSYYTIEAAIPWKSLGLDAAPDADALMRCNIEVRDRRDGAMVIETIPETQARQSWTWPEFRLQPGSSASVPEHTAGNQCVSITNNADAICIYDPEGHISSARLIPLSGVAAVSASRGDGYNANVPVNGMKGIFLLRIEFSDGSLHHEKIKI